MLTPYEIREILKAGEDVTVEFKRSFSEDSFGTSIAAFATDYKRGGGGRVLLGAGADRTIIGIHGDRI